VALIAAETQIIVAAFFFGLFACMKRDLHQRAIRQPFSCSLSLAAARSHEIAKKKQGKQAAAAAF
jgi:hypothetical protein